MAMKRSASLDALSSDPGASGGLRGMSDRWEPGQACAALSLLICRESARWTDAGFQCWKRLLLICLSPP